jgi:hypothetical protein
VSVLCPGNVRTNIASSERRARASTPDPRRDAVVAQKIAEGSDPAEIAGQVIQAVRAGVFYVMTWGDGWGEAVKSRFADIIERRRPTLPNFS